MAFDVRVPLRLGTVTRMSRGAVTYTTPERDESQIDRYSEEYLRETAMAAALRLADDLDHQAKVAELRRRIAAGDIGEPMDPAELRDKLFR